MTLLLFLFAACSFGPVARITSDTAECAVCDTGMNSSEPGAGCSADCEQCYDMCD